MSVVMQLLKPNGDNPDNLFDYKNNDMVNKEVLEWHYIRWMCSQGRSWKRVSQALSKFDWLKYTDKETKRTEKVLPCDVCAYAQGWFFKKAFFNKKATYMVCTTKEEMQNVMLRYMKFTDENARNVYKEFMAKWEDGMLFQVSY